MVDQDGRERPFAVWNQQESRNGIAVGRPIVYSLADEPVAGRAFRHFEGDGSFDQFKTQFSQTAVTTFGSGWAWLVKKPDGWKIAGIADNRRPDNIRVDGSS